MMSGRRLSPLKRVFNPDEWTRFNIEVCRGDCLAPLMPPGTSFVLFDRKAIIRRGDLVMFNTRSPWTLWERLTVLGYLKRFLGANTAAGTFEFEMTNPPVHFSARLDGIKWAYRVRAQGTLRHVIKAWWEIKRDPAAHDGWLGNLFEGDKSADRQRQERYPKSPSGDAL